ncbi:MAG TPA: type III-A CRISPR-associated RAMP protein Csm3 [Bryobacteraceae bacterium]|nr:type III-A CRISPR-associated RAMP protein Csm3 [Bryobacteraceae bacterium]
MPNKWTHVVEMKFEVEILDGMRIGGAGGSLEIGGVDLLPLKDPITGEPYIPGSSLKGKLRSTLEKQQGRTNGSEPCVCGEMSCPVCPIFGAHKKTKPPCGASRLTVRDARFTDEYRAFWNSRGEKGLPQWETKAEVTADRQYGVGSNPRWQERVPAGAVFAGEMVLKVFEGDDDGKMLGNIKNALAIIERFDSL